MFPTSEGKKGRKRDKMKSSLQGEKLKKSEVIERRKREGAFTINGVSNINQILPKSFG